jgi:hypothetical protein
MSFLSGISNFLKSKSIGSSLVKTAALGFILNKLTKSALKDNQSGTDNIDNGVRLQVAPNAESKIPVLYGDSYFGGNITDAAMTNDNKTMWYCLALSEQVGTKFSDSADASYAFEDAYWNDQRIVFESDGVTVSYTVDRDSTIDRSLSGLVKVYFYAGDTTSANQIAPDGHTVTAANAYDLFPNWTSSTHLMDGLVFALIRVDYNREKNVTGIGDMLFHVSNDMYFPGDVIYDYLSNTVYGAGISTSAINTDDILALNSYSDQSLSYDDEGTGAQTLADRYQINGVIDTANPVLQNAEAILSAAASWLSYDSHEGKWGIVINKAESSIASFDDSNILGTISVSGTGLQDLYNSVNVQFPHRDLRDSGDFVKIEIPDADRNANEEDNSLEITYDIINEPIQAQLLGFIELKQSRVDKIIQFEIDYGTYNLQAGDVIDVTNTRYNFTNKLFRIISITEMQENDGPLMMEITALEYDSNVYSTADLYRYTRSDSNGIITIGSIGTPGTPSVTKYEIATRPRIEIDSTSPTGVVEGLEFWLTTDVAEPDDNLRSYTLIGTVRPIGGGVFTSGTTVTLEYSSLETSDFYIKTRGFNTTTVGPYSTPSGLVEFEPTQVTNAITEDTIVSDGLGGLLTTLAVVDLLQGVDDLYGLVGGEGSLFESIFDVFEDVTGFDLVGEASGGELIIPTNLAILAEGTSIVTSTSSIDFTGTGVDVSATDTDVTIDIPGLEILDDGTSLVDNALSINFTGNVTVTDSTGDITVDISGGATEYIDDLLDVDTTTTAPVIDDLLTWDGTNWVPITRNEIVASGGGYYSTNPESCSLSYLSSGRTAIAPPAIPASVDDCESAMEYSITPVDADSSAFNSGQPYEGESWTTTSGTPIKQFAGGTSYNVTYYLTSTGVTPTVGEYYVVSGITPSSFNGVYECTASSSTSIRLLYLTDPGTYSSGAGTATIHRAIGSVPVTNLKSLFISEDTSTSGSYTISLSTDIGILKLNGFANVRTDDSFTHLPTSVSADEYTNNAYYSPAGGSPLVVTGSYDCINQVLSNIRWNLYEYNVYGDLYQEIPGSDGTISIDVTVDGSTLSQDISVEYVDNATLYPFG